MTYGSGSYFGLVWPGKDAAAAEAHSPAAAVPDKPVGGGTRHRLFVGDNMDVLKHLAATEPGSVDVIYIDPPYNSERNFVYRNNYRGRREPNATDFGQWHAPWLSMMLPRLILARKVLRETGFICMSIGDDEAAHLRVLADEVFGEDCYAGQLIWEKGGTGKNDSRYAVQEHEYVLVYARSPQNPGFNDDPHGHRSTHYNHSDDKGNYSLVRLDSKTLGYLPTLDFPITGPDGRDYWPDQPTGRTQVARWRWSKEKVSEHYDELVFRRGFVYTKNYEKPGARPRSLMPGERFGVTRTGRKEAEDALGLSGVFDFPKPVTLVKHLIGLCGGKDAAVLDFFAGSGTTAQAVAELNAQDGGTRTVTLVQLPVPLADETAASDAGLDDVAAVCAARMRAAGLDFDEYRMLEAPGRDLA